MNRDLTPQEQLDKAWEVYGKIEEACAELHTLGMSLSPGPVFDQTLRVRHELNITERRAWRLLRLAGRNR